MNHRYSTFIHGKVVAVRKTRIDQRHTLREISRIETLIENGMKGQWIINRLNDLVEELTG